MFDVVGLFVSFIFMPGTLYFVALPWQRSVAYRDRLFTLFALTWTLSCIVDCPLINTSFRFEYPEL